MPKLVVFTGRNCTGQSYSFDQDGSLLPANQGAGFTLQSFQLNSEEWIRFTNGPINSMVYGALTANFSDIPALQQWNSVVVNWNPGTLIGGVGSAAVGFPAGVNFLGRNWPNTYLTAVTPNAVSKFYQDGDYGAKEMDLLPGHWPADRWYADGEGDYNDGGMNDTISSLKVPAGFAAFCADNIDGSGVSQTFYEGDYPAIPAELNDKISYIDIHRVPGVPIGNVLQPWVP